MKIVRLIVTTRGKTQWDNSMQKVQDFFAAAFGLVSKQSNSFTVNCGCQAKSSIKSIVNFKPWWKKKGLNSAFSV